MKVLSIAIEARPQRLQTRSSMGLCLSCLNGKLNPSDVTLLLPISNHETFEFCTNVIKPWMPSARSPLSFKYELFNFFGRALFSISIDSMPHLSQFRHRSGYSAMLESACRNLPIAHDCLGDPTFSDCLHSAKMEPCCAFQRHSIHSNTNKVC